MAWRQMMNWLFARQLTSITSQISHYVSLSYSFYFSMRKVSSRLLGRNFTIVFGRAGWWDYYALISPSLAIPRALLPLQLYSLDAFRPLFYFLRCAQSLKQRCTIYCRGEIPAPPGNFFGARYELSISRWRHRIMIRAECHILQAAERFNSTQHGDATKRPLHWPSQKLAYFFLFDRCKRQGAT